MPKYIKHIFKRKSIIIKDPKFMDYAKTQRGLKLKSNASIKSLNRKSNEIKQK